MPSGSRSNLVAAATAERDRRSYADRSTDDALELFRTLRQQTHDLITTLPESTWPHTCYHPENGNMSRDDWLDVYAVHIPGRLGCMRENYNAWLAPC